MIDVCSVSKTYLTNGAPVPALVNVSLHIQAGEFIALVGASGSGKSTLLHCLGGLDRFDSGEIRIAGSALSAMSDAELTQLRRQTIGFVFQFFHLMPTLTVQENVALPSLLAGRDGTEIEQRASHLLEAVGLKNRAFHLPHQLSGGEMQRAAVARALVHKPTLLLADEPTGNLDSANSTRVLDLIRQLTTAEGTTVVMVTHSSEIAEGADRIIRMKDGQVIEDGAP
ncbi:MAG: ABC transporter ATP-binding protein [Candidatus Methylacidiphilales bacterium]